MTKTTITHEESIELKHLYESFSMAIERASAAMHMRGIDSPSFLAEDAKCVAIWRRIRELMEEVDAPGNA